MTPQEFCYWLQGFAELTADAPTPEQWSAIKDHLQLTFVKVTPTYDWSKLPFGQTPGTQLPYVVTC